MSITQKNKQGFSVVESMVALGLIAGLAVAGMKAFQGQAKDQKSIEMNYGVAAQVEKIRALLASEENCKATFLNVPAANGRVNVLKHKRNGTFVDAYPVEVRDASGLGVTSYKLSSSATGIASNEIMLEVGMSRGKTVRKDEALKMVRLHADLDGTGRVTSCFSFSNSTVFWKRSEVDSNDIFYSRGPVGIGTTNPKAQLDVTGHIKLGPPGTCDAAAEGAVAYDPALSLLVFCDGVTWKSPGGTDSFTTHTTNCAAGGSQRSTSITLGTKSTCFLMTVSLSNIGRDDHTRGRCTLTKSGSIWSLEALCKESDSSCKAVCNQ